MKRTSVIFLIAISLSGCVSAAVISRALSYPSSYTNVKMPDDTYRVFEHKSDSTLMTTSSLGAGISRGAAKGLTLGLAEPFSPEQKHEAAAKQYLDQTGRPDCTISKGYLLAQPQYEFAYECPKKQ
jgi:hypothetical protein